ncbi:LSU ribosomal protein L9p [Brachybacterium faecium]|uniref:Large ribosomal subunit protein bL9 n=1 Tax=Brachybacterium faecium (strain ATCC 43885 / DSM 4810 / JCM 11609 / LMG 19847 / NBRC 14762 / NCIMB 9860 / 6-10) TaxID=446465 RepID=C7MB46_BRAFD|nr:50S ribosomal protein L9 [Brachybacterium faecium]ACU86933.1 LSU ribosomal protein L9P [Brachybacterium faecium DSM 4810]SLN01778.1 LSU ribosomal protein L9p [Brachybacterium faecium]HJG52491.1 50S ribosomal protein L9 [Brachybacterium faecium]
MTTKLILTHEVTGLGAAGDVVDVKDGYARNFLMPRGLATPWTKGGQRQLDQIRAARGKRAIASIEEAQALKASLESKPLVLAERAGQNGRLFGAVSSKEVAEAVKEMFDKDIDRRTVEFVTPIRSLGEHKATVRLHDDIFANLVIQVIAAKGAPAKA